uniref:Transposase n=1 Tax=Rhodococcus sp. NS1 TaxID=402236 RepID=A0A097SQW4_9NOCA|nr:hypothetical protein LRS1606.487 [Rhodococcus sp. NS1]
MPRWSWVRRSSTPQAWALRCRIILACAEGASNKEVTARAWIAQWNTDPKPYVWTKTADEIMERFASYLNRIPDSEH